MQTISQKAALKYPIREKLNKMDGNYSRNFLKMCLHVDISATTGHRWASVTKTEQFSIPVDKFYLLADFFNCNPTELLNHG